MTLTQLDAELREYYTKNKEGKGGGYGMRAIRQYVNELPLGEKLQTAIGALEAISDGEGDADEIARQTLTELKQQP